MVLSLAAGLDRRAVLPAGGAPGLAAAESSQGGREVRPRRAGGPIRARPAGRDRRPGAGVQPDGGSDHHALSAERRLLQDVSHELRSPLARLGFAVELAKTSPDREAALARIRKEADRLVALVDELLQLTRAEGDPTARNLEKVDLGELLGDVVASCRARGRSAGLPAGARDRLDGGRDRRLRAAPARLRQRAAQRDPACPEGELGRGRASTQRQPCARSRFRDHGPGVPAGRAPRDLQAVLPRREATAAAPAAASAWAWPSPAAPSSCTRDRSPPGTPTPGCWLRSSCRLEGEHRGGGFPVLGLFVVCALSWDSRGLETPGHRR